jgi:quinol monooxygenase YgiN/catechol 2,3-dioxygenase-like lactoylglutathione lyase family enzyme
VIPVVVSTQMRVRPGMQERLVAALAPVIERGRAEPSCLAYELHRVLDDPTVYLLYECWRSHDDLQRHRAARCACVLGQAEAELLATPTEVSVCAPVDAPHVHPTEQLVLELFVRDIGRSTAFYRALGFELLRDAGSFVELTWERHRFFLDERRGLPPDPAYPQANVRVLVADVDAWWERARELDAPVLQPIGDRDYGLRDFTVVDPDGFGVRFGTRIPGRP